jgi:hypothetical protein
MKIHTKPLAFDDILTYTYTNLSIFKHLFVSKGKERLGSFLQGDRTAVRGP